MPWRLGNSKENLFVNEDFRDMLSCLNAQKVEYLVVGAYALAAHGVPRATGDIDIWIRPEKANAERVFRALAAFGAPLKGLKVDDFTEPGISFQIGVAPRKIDIITSISGVSFSDALPARIVKKIDNIDIPFIGHDDFVKNKKAAGRPKDISDIALLEEA